MNRTDVKADCRCAEMQCCLSGKSDDGEMISGLLKKRLKNSHCRVREYFHKGIKIPEGVYIAYLLLKYNSDMENEKKRNYCFNNANIAKLNTISSAR